MPIENTGFGTRWRLVSNGLGVQEPACTKCPPQIDRFNVWQCVGLRLYFAWCSYFYASPVQLIGWTGEYLARRLSAQIILCVEPDKVRVRTSNWAKRCKEGALASSCEPVPLLLRLLLRSSGKSTWVLKSSEKLGDIGVARVHPSIPGIM